MAHAQMLRMNDEDMSAMYATGFSNFSVTNGIAKAELNINAATYTEIDSLKLGYHDEYNYKDPNPGFGWDEDWTGVSIGKSSTDHSGDFKTTGIFLEAKFSNIDNPATRKLEYVKLGVNTATGDLSATFNSLSGDIDDGNGSTPEYNGHGLNLGNKTITCNNSEFTLKLSATGANKGWWVHFTNATVAP